MKKLLIIGILLSLYAFTTAPVHQDRTESRKRWVELGTRKVSKNADRDVLLVTARKGFFTKLRIKVTDSPVWVHRVRIIFGNGSEKVIEVDKNFRPGDVAVIDLPGNRRIIKKIIFRYHTKFHAIGKGKIHVWGRR